MQNKFNNNKKEYFSDYKNSIHILEATQQTEIHKILVSNNSEEKQNQLV